MVQDRLNWTTKQKKLNKSEQYFDDITISD
jgi:hypothetical protein